MDEIMSAEEVAKFLRLDRRTVINGAIRGDIPGRRVGRRWVFSRSALMVWLGAHGQGRGAPAGGNDAGTT